MPVEKEQTIGGFKGFTVEQRLCGMVRLSQSIPTTWHLFYMLLVPVSRTSKFCTTRSEFYVLYIYDHRIWSCNESTMITAELRHTSAMIAERTYVIVGKEMASLKNI